MQQGFYVFGVTRVGKVYIARDGGLTPERNEADITSEDVADDLMVLASKEYDMPFDIAPNEEE
jgi:hypothetical protein